MEGMWFGATVRSTQAHARLVHVGWRDQAPSGCLLLTAEDLVGPNEVQLIDDSWPILADDRVHHVGEPVALVAAPTREGVNLARAAVEVVYQALPAVLDVETARSLEPLSECSLEHGDPAGSFEAADTVIEGSYRTGHQEHVYIECQAMTAWWTTDPKGLEIVGTMQCPYYVHKSVTHAFDLDGPSVRIRASAVGGGFGGKEDFPSVIAIHAALLAQRVGHPVRIAYDRHEDILGTTKRHPALMRYRTAVDSEGRLLAHEIEIEMDGGAYSTLSSVVLSRALLHACGPYRCHHVKIRGRVLRTNTPPNGAFRGFGAPQVAFAVERHIDRIGRQLGIDPLTMRRRNALIPGDVMPTGQVVDETTSALACLDSVAKRTDFLTRWEAGAEVVDSKTRRGIGLSLFFHGAGFTGNGERRMKSPATAQLDAEGRILVLSAMTDMGQGCGVVFRQIAADSAGVDFEDLAFPDPDTSRVPDSGPTVASRTTMIVGQLVSRAVGDLSARLGSWWIKRSGRVLEKGASEVAVSGHFLGVGGVRTPFREVARTYLKEVGPLSVTVEHEPPSGPTFDESTYRGPAYPTYAWGADIAEVEVDLDTLIVRPLSVTVATEVGRAIHPQLCVGQIEGGTLQAVGWALWEEMKVEEGRYLNDRLATYIIPTAMDAPRLDVELLEAAYEGGPFGAKGIGELPMDGGAPAVLAAIETATNLVLDEIPATPERLLSAQLAGAVESV